MQAYRGRKGKDPRIYSVSRSIRFIPGESLMEPNQHPWVIKTNEALCVQDG
jgi:hypothetical protein